jgi:hypothetical protein
LQQELAFAFKNKVHYSGNAWLGKMSDGVKREIAIVIRNGQLKTAYPIFK